MSYVKMTNNLVSTKAFTVTLTYPKNEYSQSVLSVIPKISHSNVEMTDQFYHFIVSDPGFHNRRQKEQCLSTFLSESSREIYEEFWDSAQWKMLERICLTLPYLTCVLYDTQGDVVETRICKTVDVLKSLQKIEEALFTSTLQATVKRSSFGSFVAHKKEFRRKANRETHKYFMHHRSR